MFVGCGAMYNRMDDSQTAVRGWARVRLATTHLHPRGSGGMALPLAVEWARAWDLDDVLQAFFFRIEAWVVHQRPALECDPQHPSATLYLDPPPPDVRRATGTRSWRPTCPPSATPTRAARSPP